MAGAFDARPELIQDSHRPMEKPSPRKIEFAVKWLPRAIVAIATVCWLLLPVVAFGHAQLLRSIPAHQSELAQAPSEIEIWFNELLEEEFNSIKVFSSSDYSAKTRTD